LYADVAALSDDQMSAHYQQFGQVEGRSPVALFDPRFYAEGSGLGFVEALHDYETRERLEADPHPLFDLDFYRSQAGETPDPVVHYSTEGWKEGFDPHPLFSTRYYVEQVGRNGFSDRDPLSDFILYGWRLGRRPNPLFDVEFYLSQNRDVAEAASNPLNHYSLVGWKEGRSPHGLFDVNYYRSQLADDVEPLSDYLHGGADAGLDPHPLFSTDYYRACSPDLAAAPINPLAHFASFGGYELRRHHPLFEPQWYAERTQCDGIPLVHYLETAGRHDPSPAFNTRWYLRHNAPARRSDLSPLEHWVVHEARSGRSFSSLPIDEVVLDLLGSGEVTAASCLIRQRRSDDRKSQVVLPFEVDSQAGHIDAGYALSVLPGAISDSGKLIGGLHLNRSTISTDANAIAIVHVTSGIATGSLSPTTIENVTMVAQSHQASDWEWYLRCLPALVEAGRSSHASAVVIPSGISRLDASITQFALSEANLIELAPGSAVRLRNCTIVAQRSPSPVARSSVCPTSSGPLLVLDEHDPFDDQARASLVAAVLAAGGSVVDTLWGPQVLVHAITRATRIIAAEAVPLIAFFALVPTTVVSLIDDLPAEARFLEEIGLQLEMIRLPPIGIPVDQHHRPNLDPSAKLTEIIGGQS